MIFEYILLVLLLVIKYVCFVFKNLANGEMSSNESEDNEDIDEDNESIDYSFLADIITENSDNEVAEDLNGTMDSKEDKLVMKKSSPTTTIAAKAENKLNKEDGEETLRKQQQQQSNIEHSNRTGSGSRGSGKSEECDQEDDDEEEIEGERWATNGGVHDLLTRRSDVKIDSIQSLSAEFMKSPRGNFSFSLSTKSNFKLKYIGANQK